MQLVKVLVNNVKSTNSTLLVRLLKRIHRFPIEVIGSDVSDPGSIASSILVDEYIKSPSMNNETEYLVFLNEIYKKYKIDFLFISTDKEVRFVDRHKSEIRIPFFNPPSNTIAIFQDKLKATIAMNEIGVTIPQIYSDLFGKEKVIFRKKRSVSSEGIYIADFSKMTYIENHFQADWFAQKYISGTTYVVDVFADKNGKPKLIIPRKSIEVQKGSAFRSQVIKNEKVIETCKMIYSNYLIPGLSNIEFIENADGLHFIEINLRIGGSATAGIVASFNYIEQFLDHFVNGKSLESLDTYMKCISWNSIVSRYYDEVIATDIPYSFPVDHKSNTQNDK